MTSGGFLSDLNCFWRIMLDVFLAVDQEKLLASRGALQLRVNILSPSIIIRARPEEPDSAQLEVVTGDIRIGPVHAGTMVIESVRGNVLQSDHGDSREFVKQFKIDLGLALSITPADVFHVNLHDATIPELNQNPEWAQLRHLIRESRDGETPSRFSTLEGVLPSHPLILDLGFGGDVHVAVFMAFISL